MKAKLEDFYGDEFENPSVKPTSREIIQAMLARGDKPVACWVSNYDANPTIIYPWTFIVSVSDDGFIDEWGSTWKIATPYDPRTGTEITELPE